MAAGLIGGVRVGCGGLVDGMGVIVNGEDDRWIDRWVNCCVAR